MIAATDSRKTGAATTTGGGSGRTGLGTKFAARVGASAGSRLPALAFHAVLLVIAGLSSVCLRLHAAGAIAWRRLDLQLVEFVPLRVCPVALRNGEQLSNAPAWIECGRARRRQGGRRRGGRKGIGKVFVLQGSSARSVVSESRVAGAVGTPAAGEIRRHLAPACVGSFFAQCVIYQNRDPTASGGRIVHWPMVFSRTRRPRRRRCRSRSHPCESPSGCRTRRRANPA